MNKETQTGTAYETRRPLRVLLWHWGRRGGGPRYTLELARALSARDDVDVALSLSKDCEIFKSFVEIGFARFDIHTYRNIRSALFTSIKLPIIRAAFWRFVRDKQIDVVVCTMSHLWNVPVLLGKPGFPPFISVLHDAVPHPGENFPFRFGLLRAEVKRSQAVITLTEHVQSIVCGQYPYPKDRTYVVPHGVFPYAKPRGPTAKGPVRLLFFGRILFYKGLDLLLEAHRLLRSRGIDVHLTIAGPGNIGPYRDSLKGLDHVFVDNRWIDEDGIEEVFRTADLTVLPYREASQSGVIATSFAAGIPVVVTPTGGLVEQVQHGVNGLVCDNQSAEAIANSIEMMVNNTELRFDCAEGALRTAKEDLSWSSIASKMASICTKLQSKAGSARFPK